MDNLSTIGTFGIAISGIILYLALGSIVIGAAQIFLDEDLDNEDEGLTTMIVCCWPFVTVVTIIWWIMLMIVSFTRYVRHKTYNFFS